jgi:hypothetical protein
MAMFRQLAMDFGHRKDGQSDSAQNAFGCQLWEVFIVKENWDENESHYKCRQHPVPE